MLDVPTGLGKTAGAVLAWLWRRRFDPRPQVRDHTPRRLVYCLPMRVLVEQTYRVTTNWLENLGLLVDRTHLPEWARPDGDYGEYPIAVHLLLGGGENPMGFVAGARLDPDRNSGHASLSRSESGVFRRTRALAAGVRFSELSTAFGYSTKSRSWTRVLPPVCNSTHGEGVCHSAGHAPSSRPRAREHTAKPCNSLWMSATMSRHWLQSAVDWSPRAATEWDDRSTLSDRDRADQHVHQLFKVTKALAKAPIELEKPKTKENKADPSDADRKQADYLRDLADDIGKHRSTSGLTLIILNTVDRATNLFRLLRKRTDLAGVPIWLIHSRFRPLERERWREFLEQKDQAPRILVSTQVVEAGVDLSAGVLYTELAPWASLVQRFGRCARYPGESGTVFWLDLDLGSDTQRVDHWARPYERLELIAARKKLGTLHDVGLQTLTAVKIDVESTDACAKALFPYEPRFVPRDKDLFDLFDTTPDLTGADVDVSRFIRDGEELDIQVFWRDLSGEAPGRRCQPYRLELCPVPFHRFRRLVDGFAEGWPHLAAQLSQRLGSA